MMQFFVNQIVLSNRFCFRIDHPIFLYTDLGCGKRLIFLDRGSAVDMSCMIFFYKIKQNLKTQSIFLSPIHGD